MPLALIDGILDAFEFISIIRRRLATRLLLILRTARATIIAAASARIGARADRRLILRMHAERFEINRAFAIVEQLQLHLVQAELAVVTDENFFLRFGFQRSE